MLAIADVGGPTRSTRAHLEVAEALGDIDILVNNAGTNTARRNWRAPLRPRTWSGWST